MNHSIFDKSGIVLQESHALSWDPKHNYEVSEHKEEEYGGRKNSICRSLLEGEKIRNIWDWKNMVLKSQRKRMIEKNIAWKSIKSLIQSPKQGKMQSPFTEVRSKHFVSHVTMQDSMHVYANIGCIMPSAFSLFFFFQLILLLWTFLSFTLPQSA